MAHCIVFACEEADSYKTLTGHVFVTVSEGFNVQFFRNGVIMSSNKPIFV